MEQRGYWPVTVDEGPTSAEDEVAVLRIPILPVPAPKFKTAVETTAEEVAVAVGQAGC